MQKIFLNLSLARAKATPTEMVVGSYGGIAIVLKSRDL
jgi:hypothetical protein